MTQQRSSSKKGVLSRLSIRSKILIMILVIVIPCIGFVGQQGIYHGQKALTESLYNQLTSLRSARAQQLQEYFLDKRGQMKILSEDLMIVEAMTEFSSGYSLLSHYKKNLNDEQKQQLENYYRETFLPRFAKQTETAPSFSDIFPTENVTQYLQYQYIVNNANAQGSKSILKKANDASYYSEVHAKYHPLLKNIVENYGYYDLFLIHPETGDIIYSVDKEMDFANSAKEGAYRQSSLSILAKKVMKNPQRGLVLIEDFKNNKASYGKPDAFLAAPIYDNSHDVVGILAVRISSTAINEILTGKQRWVEDGLGNTGEVYLVGRDFTMRSDHRLFLEDRQAYKALQTKVGMNASDTEKILTLGTTVLNQRVDTEASRRAAEGKTGVAIVDGYHKISVLSAYAPLNIPGLQWSILAEKDVTEVNKPITNFQRSLLVSMCLLGALVTFLALWLANRFVKPIYVLTDGIQHTKKNNYEKIVLNREDEFGELANAFNGVLENVCSQQKVIEKQSAKIKELMLNMMPAVFASRMEMESEEHNIAESYSNVAVLFTNLRGFSALMDTMEPSESIRLLNALIGAYDEIAEKHGVEKVKTAGDSYIAACGLSDPRLDYAKRCFEFAKDLFFVVDSFNREHKTELSLSVSISSGDVIAGIIGRKGYVYDIWGKTVTLASRLRYDAIPNSIRVSQSVYQQLSIKDGFRRCDTIKIRGLGEVVTWEYEVLGFDVSAENQQGHV